MKSIRSVSKLALLVVLLAPVVSFGEKPDKTDKPTTRPFANRQDYLPRPPRPGRDFTAGPKPTKEELDSATDFAKKNFPVFYDMYTRLPENGPMRAALMQRMVGRYRNMLRQQEQNPELYDALLSQAKLEDEALGYLRELRTRSSPSGFAPSSIGWKASSRKTRTTRISSSPTSSSAASRNSTECSAATCAARARGLMG
jgi:hypothetical protein